MQYAAVIATMFRPEKLQRCIDALAQIPPEHQPERVVVGDDSLAHDSLQEPDTYREKRETICKQYQETFDLEIVDLPVDSGRPGKLNVGIERTEAPHLLVLDDDIYVPSNVYEMSDILVENKELGGVAFFLIEHGQVQCNAGDLKIEDGWLLKGTWEDKPPEKTGTGHSMFRYDQIPPIGMFRRDTFEDYTWDNRYVVGEEDTDFFLTHAQQGRWEFAVLPSYTARHDPGPGEIKVYFDERRSRNKLNQSNHLLTSKFDIKGMFQLNGHLDPDRPLPDRILRWVAFNIVPYSVLWRVKRSELGHRIQKRLISSFE